MAGHRAVDIVCQRDELCLIAIETHLPREVEGIHRDAVPADPWARVEGHEAEGFRCGGINDFPGVDPEIPAHEGKLVGERDVHIPEDVLVELRQLGDLWGRDLVHPRDDLPVERGRQARAGGRDASHHFWDVLDLEGGIPRVDALGGERQEDVLSDSGSVRLKQRHE